MARRLRIPISKARSQLFQLTDLVRSGDDTVVVLEQRGGKDPVVLVREARLAYLEARAAEVDKRETKAFQLKGSITTTLSDEELEEVMRDIRRGWGPPMASSAPAARLSDVRRRR